MKLKVPAASSAQTIQKMNNSNIKTVNNLKVGHWNSNSIKNKNFLFNKFMNENNFDIFCLNETKLSVKTQIEFENYNIIRKDRNSRGGGVAVLIKNNLQFTHTNIFDKFNLELIHIKVTLAKCDVNVISIYSPPNDPNQTNQSVLSSDFFNEIKQLKNVMLIGDLNCQSTNWYCAINNTNGSRLSDLISDYNLNILNSNKSTYLCTRTNKENETRVSKSIIDLFIISNDLSDKFKFFKVYSDNLTSNHFSICAQFEIETLKNNSIKKVIYSKSTNWLQFQLALDTELKSNFKDLDINEQTDKEVKLNTLYQKFILSVKNAEQASTETVTKRLNSKTLPNFLVEIIKSRKKLIQQLSKNKFQNSIDSIKKKINQYTSIIRSELKAIRESEFLKFCKSIENQKTSSSDYWKKIKFISKLETKTINKRK